MMTLFNRTILALALVGVMSMVAAASVPFRGSGHAEVIAVQPIGTQVLMTATATGQATHLGRFTRIENILLNPADGTFTGDVTFTAANGDHLTANITGGFTSASTASGSYSFTGGTGRFANAAGTAYFSATLSDPSHFTVEFGGSILY
jgi:hypothetical protein